MTGPEQQDPGHPQEDHPQADGMGHEGALLIAALKDAANAWTERIRAGVEDGNQTCGVCPVCLTVAHVGQSHPDFVEHLTQAASALGAAVTAATHYYQATRQDQPPADPDAPHPQHPGGPEPHPRRKVQHITVTD